MPRRKLTLVRESLSDLAADELAALAAGQPEAPPTRYCYTAGVQCFLRESLRYCQITTVGIHSLSCIEP